MKTGSLPIPRLALGLGFLFLAAIAIGSTRPVLGADELVIAGVQGFSEDEAGTVILKEAYRRIGIAVKIQRLPAKRALIKANGGEFDGDLQRIEGIEKNYKNLIPIRPAINYFEASAFSSKHDFEVEDWTSLRPYRVGIIRGMKFAEANTQGMNTVKVDSYETLLRMLDGGRIDVGVLPRINGLFQRAKWGVPSVRELKPPLLRIYLFHYIHRKNAKFVRSLSATVKAMQQSGELEKMRERANEVLLETAKTPKE